MEIIVKRDILDELLAKGLFLHKEEASAFLQKIVNSIVDGIILGNKVVVQGFGSFVAGNKASENFTVLPSNKFLTEITDSFEMDYGKSQKAWDALFNFFKGMLIKGHEIQIVDFAYFRIEEKKHKNSFMPAQKILVFAPEKKICEKLGKQEVRFTPDKEFQKQIALLKSSTILLVVPRLDFFVKTIGYHFEKAGWRVTITQNIDEAKSLIKSGKVYLVILDSLVDEYIELCELIKCRKDINIPLIVTHPKGTNFKKPKDFQICSDEDIIQPFEVNHLIRVAESVLRRASEKGAIFQQELELRFLTLDKHIDKANKLCGNLLAMSGLNEEDRVSVAAAFREAVANAAQHGNKHRRDKLLEVLYLLDKEKIIVSVTDSGMGFDWPSILNKEQDAVGRARQSQREGKLGGLGIMLMMRCVDKIEYNELGNVVTLIKYLKKRKK